MILVGILVFCAALWALVTLSLWLNPPLRTPAPGKSVTISGRPVEILPLQNFTVTMVQPCGICEWRLNKGACTHYLHRRPSMLDLIPSLYDGVLLEGLLLRGIVDTPRPVTAADRHSTRNMLRALSREQAGPWDHHHYWDSLRQRVRGVGA